MQLQVVTPGMLLILRHTLNIQVHGLQSAFSSNELAAAFDVFAHQRRENFLGGCDIVQGAP